MADRFPLRIVIAALAVLIPEAASAQAARALPKVAFRSLITGDDYPLSALRDNVQGVVHFRLGVNPTGTVSNCTILISSGSPVLDAATCQILTERATFRPARDAAGQSIAGSYDGKLGWAVETMAMMPGLFTATRQWMKCASPRAIEMAAGSRSVEAIVEQAFEGCLRYERKVIDLLQAKRTEKLEPAAASVDSRLSLRAGLIRTINSVRAQRR